MIAEGKIEPPIPAFEREEPIILDPIIHYVNVKIEIK